MHNLYGTLIAGGLAATAIGFIFTKERSRIAAFVLAALLFLFAVLETFGVFA